MKGYETTSSQTIAALEPFKGTVVIATKLGFQHGPQGLHLTADLGSYPGQFKPVADASPRRLRGTLKGR